MTTSSTCPLSLPHHRHITWPVNRAHQVEYGIELAIRLYADYDEGDALDMVRVARPDLTIAEINERVWELSHLSNLASEAQHTSSLEAWECAKGEYADALTKLATAPGLDVDDALAIANDAPVCNLCDGPLPGPLGLCPVCSDLPGDELAKRRNRP